MKDISIFEGIVEFVTPTGASYRALKNYESGWKLYRLVGNTWIYLTLAFQKSKGAPTPARILDYIENHVL